MAQKETAEVEIVLSNGKKAGNTINELTGTVVKLNREIKNLTPGTAEFETKSKDLQKVQGRLNDVRKEVKGVDDATESLKGQFGDLIPFNAQFQQFKGTFGNLITSLKGAATASNILKVAMMAIPLMIIVAGLRALFSWLTSTQEGMDKVTAVTRPLSAIFEKLKGVVQELGGSVFKGLAQIINGDLKEGLKTLGTGFVDSIGNVSKAITEGAEAGKQLDQLTKSIEKAEISLATNRERLNRVFEEQKFIAEDSTKTEKERVAAAQAAQAAQDQLLAMERNILDMRIQKMEIEQSLNDTSREQELELAELIGQRDSLEAQALAKKKEARNQENSILQQGIAKEKAAIDAVQKAKEEAAAKELAYKRSVEDLKLALIEDTAEREIAQINLDTQRKIEALTGSEEQITAQKLLLEQLRDQQLEEYRATKDEEQKAKEQEKKQLAYEESLIEDEEEKLRIQEKFEATLITAEEYDEIVYQQKRAALERNLALIAEINGKESLEYKKANLEILQLDAARNSEKQANAKATAEFNAMIESKTFDATRDVFGGIADLLSQDEKTRKKHAGVIKAMKIAETTMGVVKEVQSIWETSAQLGPIAGPVMGAIQTGLAIARGAIAVGKISSTKFARGGIIKGSSHSQGGIQMIDSRTGQHVGEMEGNEPILTKGVGRTPFLRSMVNYVNQAAGGRRIYADGGIPSMPVPVNPLSASSNPNQAVQNIQSQQNESMMQNSQESNQSSAQLLSAFQDYASRVDQWARSLKVVNDPRDTDDALSNIKQVENDASI